MLNSMVMTPMSVWPTRSVRAFASALEGSALSKRSEVPDTLSSGQKEASVLGGRSRWVLRWERSRSRITCAWVRNDLKFARWRSTMGGLARGSALPIMSSWPRV